MASTQSLIDYYANLLILQYRQQPKAYATVQAMVKMMVMDQLPDQVQNAFDFTKGSTSPAVGAQLDIIGEYIGVSRQGNSFTGPVTLDDSDYLIILQIKLIEDFFGSDLKTIQDLIHTYFNGILQVYDYQDMTMQYFFDSSAGSSILAQVFVKDGLLPRPAAVRLRPLISLPTLENVFVFGSYQGPAATGKGFNNYTSYDSSWHWISYQDAIIE